MKDQNRKYLYRVLLVFAALQLYIVREWLVVFALFAVVFAIIAVAVRPGKSRHDPKSEFLGFGKSLNPFPAPRFLFQPRGKIRF